MPRTAWRMVLAAALTALALLVATGEAHAHGAAPATSVADPDRAFASAELGDPADEWPCCHAAAGGICAALAAERSRHVAVRTPTPLAPPPSPVRLRALAAPAPGVPPPISRQG
ncbi:hypothetical protein P2H44_14610 [Albimonas sp. CAU 1670]|uniref:hypothetical protein n=1 Tax=Albimonas sp. CAU 1670 TaxID=3032599 RepID=UPI0023DC1C1D|nr:hypothetical protein [Albimonas sp. CAU 1670]MDF2233790.1 hypothetical protein [Albimonas sp. CAU 1670]